MTRGRSPILRDYGWSECEADLASGVHPEVAAARLGEPIAYVLEVADRHGWPIRWQGPTPDQIVSAFRWTDA